MFNWILALQDQASNRSFECKKVRLCLKTSHLSLAIEIQSYFPITPKLDFVEEKPFPGYVLKILQTESQYKYYSLFDRLYNAIHNKYPENICFHESFYFSSFRRKLSFFIYPRSSKILPEQFKKGFNAYLNIVEDYLSNNIKQTETSKEEIRANFRDIKGVMGLNQPASLKDLSLQCISSQLYLKSMDEQNSFFAQLPTKFRKDIQRNLLAFGP